MSLLLWVVTLASFQFYWVELFCVFSSISFWCRLESFLVHIPIQTFRLLRATTLWYQIMYFGIALQCIAVCGIFTETRYYRKLFVHNMFHKLKHITSTRSLIYQQENILLNWLPSMDRGELSCFPVMCKHIYFGWSSYDV